ncbi:hypothetical protein [Leptospira andrefontaineae]|uniref:TIR domain-containing protein n=1 Tax=Leptospira andrefontaineae TaxID=2484976 RepID=A0A4R9H6G1_9LEPT|nr:hypothetical protein [Leptospira andrefontaineae]TGK41164.1 hypothetical protein EHO65_06955 [Leptospira andrefontaineae]
MKWIPIIGQFDITETGFVFAGGEMTYLGTLRGPAIGNIISDKTFNNGSIEVDIEFEKFDENSGAELIIAYDAETKAMLNAGILGTAQSPATFNIREFNGQTWTILAQNGLSAIKNKYSYNVKVNVIGSKINFSVDNVKVCQATLEAPLVPSQLGLWASGHGKVTFKNYKLDSISAKAFVVMQFSEPYQEVYREVIKNVCNEFKIETIKADEIYNNGLILDDIIESIEESFLVIAEITERNPNVFYELGYAHALNKPTILLAKKGTGLPFDVSPYRVLFYEDSIAGKSRFEEALRRHLVAFMGYTFSQ